MRKGFALEKGATIIAGLSLLTACGSSPISITSDNSRVANTPCETHDKDGRRILVSSYPLGKIAVKYRPPGIGNETALHPGEIAQTSDGNYRLFVPRLPEHFGLFKQDQTAALALVAPQLGEVSVTLGCMQVITNEFGIQQKVVNLPAAIS